jgi:hypothetical protein
LPQAGSASSTAKLMAFHMYARLWNRAAVPLHSTSAPETQLAFAQMPLSDAAKVHYPSP